ncbi:MAG: metallophosphoesterase [Spirochaetota bacterium]
MGGSAHSLPLPEAERVLESLRVLAGKPLDAEFRPTDAWGRPGGLLELPAGLRPILVGDLHGSGAHLDAILPDHHNAEDIASGSAFLLLLGDALHDDRAGHLSDPGSSIALLDQLVELIRAFPGRVAWLLGNHDSFDPELTKLGVSQGLDFEAGVRDWGGEAMVEALQAFFDSLPLFAIGEGFVATHAGPPAGGADRQSLIDLAGLPTMREQLVWNRLSKRRGRHEPFTYEESDLGMTLEALGMPAGTHFIVGHSPRWEEGDGSGFWPNVNGIAGHHILFSGARSKAPWLSFEYGKLIHRNAIRSLA